MIKNSDSDWTNVAIIALAGGLRAQLLGMLVVTNSKETPEDFRYKTVFLAPPEKEGGDDIELFSVPFHTDAVVANELIRIYKLGESKQQPREDYLIYLEKRIRALEEAS